MALADDGHVCLQALYGSVLNAAELMAIMVGVRFSSALLCAQAYNSVLTLVSRTSYVTYYRRLKDLLCCDLTHTLERMWVSWTAAATVTGALHRQGRTPTGNSDVTMNNVHLQYASVVMRDSHIVTMLDFADET